jgi:glutathione S-transferase
MAEFTIYIGNKNYSSWSLRGWLPLAHAGFDFDEVLIGIREEATAEMIRRYSGSGKVPILRHGDLFIHDSLAIGEYLAELAPQLLPAERGARALMRSVVAEMHAGFQALRSQCPMNMRASRPDFRPSPEVRADVDRVTAIWRDLRARHGGEGDWLFGTFSLADVAFAPEVSRFLTYGIDLDPVSKAYAENMWALPAMQAWLAGALAESKIIPAYEV